MNIQQLMQVTKYETVWERFCDIYDKEEKEKEFIEHVHQKLLDKIINSAESKGVIKLVYDEDDSVEGGSFDMELHEDGSDEYYCLDFMDWDRCLGYEFDVNGYDEETFLAVFLYELTFYGDEEVMVKKRNESWERRKRIENGEEEEEWFYYDSELDDFVKCTKD